MAVLDLASSVFSNNWVVHVESSFTTMGNYLCIDLSLMVTNCSGERSKQGSSTIRQIS